MIFAIHSHESAMDVNVFPILKVIGFIDSRFPLRRAVAMHGTGSNVLYWGLLTQLLTRNIWLGDRKVEDSQNPVR